MLYLVCGAIGVVVGIIAMYILVRIAFGNKRRKPFASMKRKMEFSKILAAWAVVVATATAIVSFVLSAFDKHPVSDLATVIFSTCVGYLITYAAKSAVEKTSRNKHGVDENGNPYNINKS